MNTMTTDTKQLLPAFAGAHAAVSSRGSVVLAGSVPVSPVCTR